ncbi:MAG: radical SAM protein [Treponema sp.]|uniref:radical SAM protein n=1 Tax=Treponema sp. TaxID=166 RepID=UPI003FA2CADA
MSLILKTSGSRCNLNCVYCFEKFKEVSDKAISPELLRKSISLISNISSLTFHGGEPLIIGLKKFDDLLAVVADFYQKQIEYIRIQTNGTLLNNDWINLLFHKYSNLNIEIAISLDGYRELNSLRTDFRKKESFDAVINAFKLLDKNGIKAGLLSVISKYALGNEKKYIKFLSSISNMSFVKINPLFNIHNEELSSDSLTPTEYALFISKCMQLYIKTGLYKKVAIEPILSILQKLNNKKSLYCNYSFQKCFQHLCLYPNGDISPCDCLSIDSFKIFNINEINEENFNLKKILSDNINFGAGNELVKLITACDNCDIKDFCCSGCLSQRFYFRNNRKLLDDFCEAKHLLKNSFKKFKNDRL